MSEYSIPEDLQEEYRTAQGFAQTQGWMASLAKDVLEKIERIARVEAERDTAIHMRDLEERNKIDFILQLEGMERLKAENAALKAEIQRLSAPLSDCKDRRRAFTPIRSQAMKRGWYLYCPDCGATVFLSRWKWWALWVLHNYQETVNQSDCLSPVVLKFIAVLIPERPSGTIPVTLEYVGRGAPKNVEIVEE